MAWLYFILIAQLLYTFSNFIDKTVISGYIKDYKALIVFTTIVGFAAFYLLIGIFGVPTVDLQSGAILVLTGIFSIWGLALYFIGLAKEETSKVIILFRLTSVFILILSYLFLNERYTFIQLVGYFLILAGTVFAVNTTKNTGWKQSPSFWYIVGYDLFAAISAILIKYTSQTVGFEDILIFEAFGVGLGGLVFFVSFRQVRRSFFKTIWRLEPVTIAMVVVNEIIFLMAKSLTFFAFSIGPLALVNLFSNVDIFFGIILGALLTFLNPKLFNERIDRAEFNKKLVSGLTVTAGVYIIFS
jgi:drug/metabolite transporter (DMT)-like permease